MRPPTDKPPQAKVFLAVGVEAFVPYRLVDGTGRRWRCGERRKTARWTTVVWARILGMFVVMVELKLLEFSEFRGCQPSVHHAGYGKQVACRDAEALNGALLVRGDDGSEQIKFRKDIYLTTVEIEGRGAP